MKNIYKREPIYRELPSNYYELDAIAYENLNSFKGLQIYDNPLIADSNSTYSCKNVYLDEHANLTIRPAFQHLSNDPLYSMYTDISGYKVTQSPDNNGVRLYNPDGLLSDVLGGTGRNIVVAENNGTYVFMNNINGNLQLLKVVNGKL